LSGQTAREARAVCQEQYCVGCGRFRVLITRILICRQCYDDWLRLAPGRYRDRELMSEEEHAG
jgi:hypothetical protein